MQLYPLWRGLNAFALSIAGRTKIFRVQLNRKPAMLSRKLIYPQRGNIVGASRTSPTWPKCATDMHAIQRLLGCFLQHVSKGFQSSFLSTLAVSSMPLTAETERASAVLYSTLYTTIRERYMYPWNACLARRAAALVHCSSQVDCWLF